MRLCLIISLFLSLSINAANPSKKELDRKAILAMAGAYVVDFHFEETVGFELGYDLKPAYDSAGLEIVIVVEDSEDKIVLQHILQTERGIVKHWRQDWEYQNRTLLEFQKERRWVKRELTEAEVVGTWTQRVFQVDDSPRYESFGTWQHLGNLSQWESHETRRPLPRREHTKRSDYNVLMTKNRQAMTPTGWIHEQDSFKLRLNQDEDEAHIIAREAGRNSYDHTDPDKLSEAVAWWEKHAQIWSDVRAVWTEVLKDRTEIAFIDGDEDGLPLYRHIFKQCRKSAEAEIYDSAELRQQVRKLIDDYLVTDSSRKTASL